MSNRIETILDRVFWIALLVFYFDFFKIINLPQTLSMITSATCLILFIILLAICRKNEKLNNEQ